MIYNFKQIYHFFNFVEQKHCLTIYLNKHYDFTFYT